MHESPMRTASRAVAALILAGISACGDPLSPEDVAGMYRLTSRDGAPLPVLVYSGNATDVFLVSETLVLRPDHTGQIAVVQEIRRVGGETETLTYSRDLGYDIVDDRIEITMICGPAELCTPPPHLVLYRSAVGLNTLEAPGTAPKLSYVRIPNVGAYGIP